MELLFDEERHEYRLNGVLVPSVTQILNEILPGALDGIPTEVLAAARDRGIAVHKACELDDQGELDEANLHEEIVPYLLAWRKFVLHTAFRMQVGIELRLGHAALGYAGTVDRVGTFGRTSQFVIVDIKTGAPSSLRTGLQTAAYAELMRAHCSGLMPKLRFGDYLRLTVLLQPDATYRIVSHDNPNDLADFLAALRVWKLRQRALVEA